ncbi:hypothetical protein Tco_1173136 [Tanacetum coccineum]
MASQDARISKFEADFKQYQSEMTNKIDTFWKAMNDRMTGALPSDTFKNVKLNVNHTSSVLSACSYPTGDPQNYSSYLEDSKPFDTLADLRSCVNLIPLSLLKRLKIRLLEETEDVLGLADGTKSEPTCPLLVGRGFLATVGSIIDHRKAKIAVGKGITSSIFGVKEIDFGEENIPYWTTIGKHESYTPKTSKDGIGARSPYYAKKDFWDNHLPGVLEIDRDTELNTFKNVLVFRKMVIFNEKKLESSYDFQVDDSWMTI